MKAEDHGFHGFNGFHESDRPRRPAALHFINPYINIGTMTRSEFDQQVRELKNKRGNAIREIATLQSEIKEEIAAKHRQIDDIRKEISKLQASLQGYHQRRIALETEWNAKVNAFIKEHEPSTTSNLAEATTLNIVYELRRRGFDGIVSKVDDETGDCESYDLQKQFGNGEGDKTE